MIYIGGSIISMDMAAFLEELEKNYYKEINQLRTSGSK